MELNIGAFGCRWMSQPNPNGEIANGDCCAPIELYYELGPILFPSFTSLAPICAIW